MSSGIVRVRRARRADVPAIAALAAQFGAETREKDKDQDGSPMTAADLLAQGFGPRRLFWLLVATRGGEPVGYALVYPGYDPGEATIGLHLQDIYVRADTRRAGAGRALMAAVAAETRRLGGTWYTWFVRPWNTSGRAFYRALGAKRLPSIPLYLDVARKAGRHKK